MRSYPPTPQSGPSPNSKSTALLLSCTQSERKPVQLAQFPTYSVTLAAGCVYKCPLFPPVTLYVHRTLLGVQVYNPKSGADSTGLCVCVGGRGIVSSLSLCFLPILQIPGLIFF